MDALLTKSSAGLIPGDEATRQWFDRLKLGSTVHADAKEMRNGPFFRKWWALVELGFDYWSDSVEPMEYKGEAVKPQFTRFRKDVTILAGFFEPVVNLKNETRLEAASLKWSKMSEQDFVKLYDATIHVLLNKVFNGEVCRRWSEEELRSVAEQIEAFAA